MTKYRGIERFLQEADGGLLSLIIINYLRSGSFIKIFPIIKRNIFQRVKTIWRQKRCSFRRLTLGHLSISPYNQDKAVNQHDGVHDIFQPLGIHVVQQFVAQINARRDG